MKRGYSFLEMVVGSLVLGIIFLMLYIQIPFIYFREIGLILCLLTILLALPVSLLIKLISKSKLPLDCIYSPFGFIEIHIGGKSKKNKVTFLNACLNVIKIGMEQNRDILFDTWLIREENIKKYFADAAEIYKPSFMQKIANFTTRIMFCVVNNRRKSYRCIIRTEKITNEQIKRLEEKIKDINDRNKGIIELKN